MKWLFFHHEKLMLLFNLDINSFWFFNPWSRNTYFQNPVMVARLKILQHVGLWEVKRRPPPRAHPPPIDLQGARDQLRIELS
jgi:hypothetical protein